LLDGNGYHRTFIVNTIVPLFEGNRENVINLSYIFHLKNDSFHSFKCLRVEIVDLSSVIFDTILQRESGFPKQFGMFSIHFLSDSIQGDRNEKINLQFADALSFGASDTS
jgi:hypothetical protein